MEKIKKVNKRWWEKIYFTLAIIVLLCFLGVNPQATGKFIVVNPGHMVETDPGAVNAVTKIREVDLNNALAIKTVKTLRDAGYNAVLSHPVPGNPGLPTLLPSIPSYDFYTKTICDAANKKGADLLISIHHNSGGNASGYELYWSSYHPEVDTDGIYQVTGLWPNGEKADLDATPHQIAVDSKALANSFNQNFKSLDYIPARNRVIERNDAIIRRTSMPSVLIEAGFVSNNEESLKLANGTNQQKMADQILRTINEFTGNTETEEMTAKSVTAGVSGTKITAKVAGIKAPAGVKEIRFPIWSSVNGQDDIKWYIGTKQLDGSYQIDIDIKDHKNDTGEYFIHCYGVDNNGKQRLLGNAIANVLPRDMTAESLKISIEGKQITANIHGITAPNGVKEVLFPIWSEVGRQDDIIWYNGVKQSDGSYQVTIDIKDHKGDTGVYNIHCYGRDNNGKQFMLRGTTTNVLSRDMTAESLTVLIEGNQIIANIHGITAPNGVKEVLFPIWSEVGRQDDIIWYNGVKQSDGSYQVTIDIKDHKGDTGVYNIHCYGRDNNGKQFMLGETTTNVLSREMTAESLTVLIEGNQIIANIHGIIAPNGVSEVLFPIWSEVGRQDDIIWYNGVKQSDGSYQVTIDIKDHKGDTGVYNIHCYGRDNNGKQFILGEAETNIEKMTAGGFTVRSEKKKIIANVSEINALNGINQIHFPIWSESGGQDDIIWYIGEKQANGSYQITADIKNHNNGVGLYHVHCYGSDNTGELIELATGEVMVSSEELITKTPIMGNTTVTAEELVDYYENQGVVYPNYYKSLGVDLNTFARIYIEEAEAEGVKAEVAFAQMLLETGSLQFGGDVKLEQFNFAGLGATGGVPGFDFSTEYGRDAHGLQMGIRGHVQHLKCYASDKPLNQENVDPRWGDWLRLRATTVEELAGTWAIDPNYGTKLLKIINQF